MSSTFSLQFFVYTKNHFLFAVYFVLKVVAIVSNTALIKASFYTVKVQRMLKKLGFARGIRGRQTPQKRLYYFGGKLKAKKWVLQVLEADR